MQQGIDKAQHINRGTTPLPFPPLLFRSAKDPAWAKTAKNRQEREAKLTVAGRKSEEERRGEGAGGGGDTHTQLIYARRPAGFKTFVTPALNLIHLKYARGRA